MAGMSFDGHTNRDKQLTGMRDLRFQVASTSCAPMMESNKKVTDSNKQAVRFLTYEQ